MTGGAAGASPPIPPDRRLTATRALRLASALQAAALAALAWYAVLFAVHALRLVRFPYQADYGEGAILNQVHRLLAGLDPYHDDRSPPFVVANYPPVYPVAAAILQRLGLGGGFAGGRLLSSCAILAAAILTGLCVRATLRADPAAGAAQPAPATGWAGAALSAGLVLAQNYVWQWGPLERVDSLALAWTMAGLYAVARRPDAAGRAWPWFVLAAFTRQSSIEGLAASVWYLRHRQPRAGRALLVSFLAASAATAAALEAATRGQFLVHTVLYNANRWSPSQFALQAATWLFAGGGLPLVALAAAGWVASRRLPAAALLRAYALCAWTVSLTAGKVGSSLNYFLPSIAAAAALAGCGAAALRRRAVGAALLLAYAVGIPPLSDRPTAAGAVARELTAYRDLGTPSYNRLGWNVPGDGRDPAQAELVAVLRRTPGPILSENMGDLVLAGHRVFFQPFELTQVQADGHWDGRPLAEMAGAGRFPLVVLEFPLNGRAGWDTQRWSPQLLDTLARRYVPAGRLGRFYLYRPGP